MDYQIGQENLEASPFDLHFQQFSLESKILLGFERIAEVLRVLLWEQAKHLNLSPIQIQILIFLKFHEAEKSTVSYLAKEFNLTKATVSDAVSVLEKKALLTKEQNIADTRSYLITLTAEGEEIVRQTENFAASLQKIIAGFSESEKDFLWHILSRLIFQANRQGLITVQRMCFNCKFYEQSNQESFCRLLNQKLESKDIRFDCPEFIEAG